MITTTPGGRRLNPANGCCSLRRRATSASAGGSRRSARATSGRRACSRPAMPRAADRQRAPRAGRAPGAVERRRPPRLAVHGAAMARTAAHASRPRLAGDRSRAAGGERGGHLRARQSRLLDRLERARRGRRGARACGGLRHARLRRGRRRRGFDYQVLRLRRLPRGSAGRRWGSSACISCCTTSAVRSACSGGCNTPMPGRASCWSTSACSRLHLAHDGQTLAHAGARRARAGVDSARGAGSGRCRDPTPRACPRSSWTRCTTTTTAERAAPY